MGLPNSNTSNEILVFCVAMAEPWWDVGLRCCWAEAAEVAKKGHTSNGKWTC